MYTCVCNIQTSSRKRCARGAEQRVATCASLSDDLQHRVCIAQEDVPMPVSITAYTDKTFTYVRSPVPPIRLKA